MSGKTNNRLLVVYAAPAVLLDAGFVTRESVLFGLAGAVFSLWTAGVVVALIVSVGRGITGW